MSDSRLQIIDVVGQHRAWREISGVIRPLDIGPYGVRRSAITDNASLCGEYSSRMNLDFDGEVWLWRGPPPYYFVTVPEGPSDELHSISHSVTYGWGMIPVTAHVGETEWTTSLFPKDGGYLVPIKSLVRRAEGIDVGTLITIRLSIDL